MRIGEWGMYFVEAGDPVKTYRIQVIHWEDRDEIYYASNEGRTLTIEQPELAAVLSELEKKGLLRLEKGSLERVTTLRVTTLLKETTNPPFIPKSEHQMQEWLQAATEALFKYLGMQV